MNEKLLVSGDFSGIQDTVYTISSKGALKSLRARSFMLEMLCEHIVYEILLMAGENPDNLIRNGTETGIIYSGGGAFSLILEKKDGLQKNIEDFRDKLNKWALKEFYGKLFIAIDVLEWNGEDFAKARKEQMDKLEKQKRRKFWTKDGDLLKELLKPKMPTHLTVDTECQITGRDDTEVEMVSFKYLENKNVTKLSAQLYYLGDELSEIKQIYRYEYQIDIIQNLEKEEFGYLLFPTNNNRFAIYSVQRISDNIQHIWTIGDNDFYYASYNQKVSDLTPYAQEIEKKIAEEEKRNFKTNSTATLDGLAACSCGADMIGSLRMDVDNLGKLFSEQKFKEPKDLAILSHDLNYFFKSILNEICKGKRVSIIYAGGDDLFIIGAWNEVVELAFDIQKHFKQYCKDKEKLTSTTISAGLTIHQPKFPLYQIAKHSEEAIDRIAKEDKDRNESEAEKNRIALFYDEMKEGRHRRMKDQFRYMRSMKWETAEKSVLKIMETFKELGEPVKDNKGREVFVFDKLPHQAIQKLFLVTERFQESGKLYMPTLARVLKQVEDRLGDRDKHLSRELIDKIYCNYDAIPNLHIALNWISYLRRTR